MEWLFKITQEQCSTFASAGKLSLVKFQVWRGLLAHDPCCHYVLCRWRLLLVCLNVAHRLQACGSVHPNTGHL